MPSKLRLLMVWLFAAGLLCAQSPAASAPRQKGVAKQKNVTPAPAKEQLYTLHGHVIASGIEKPVDSALITFRSSTTYTDDVFSNAKGEFEIELPPGDYSYEAKVYGYELDIAARRNFTIAAGKKIELLTVRMLRQAELSGIVEDADGHPLGGVQVEISNPLSIGTARGGKTGTDGKFILSSVSPGSYLIRALMVPPAPDATSTLVTTYYPSTTDSFAAEEVTLIGADLPNLRIRMERAELHSVSGRVTGHEASPSGGRSLQLQPIQDSRASFLSVATLSRAIQWRGEIDEDGAFSVGDVPPGRYIVTVAGSRSGLPLASAQITVSDRDIDDVRMTLEAGGAFSGRFVVESGKLPKDLDSTYLNGQTAAGHVSAALKVKKDGSFSLDGVPNGTYALPMLALPGYSVSSVEFGGHKYEGSKFAFEAPGSTDVVVTLASGGALIQGSLAGSRNPDQPVTGTATAVMLSGLTDGLRYMRKATLAPSGNFTIIDLEVGKYLVCVWSDYSPRVDRLLNSDKPPVERLQQLCKTVELKKDSAESIEVQMTSLAEVTR